MLATELAVQPITLRNEVGNTRRPGANRSEDVEKVAILLEAIFARKPFHWQPLPVSSMHVPALGVCTQPPPVDQELIEEIRLFQEDCKLPLTGVVDGRTLGCMNQIATPLVLNPVDPAYLPYGYRLNYQGAIPSSRYRVLLFLARAPVNFEYGKLLRNSDLQACVDLSGVKAENGTRIIPAKLEELLGVLSGMNPPGWSTSVHATLLVTLFDNVLITQSNTRMMQTPVPPYAFEPSTQLNDEPNLGEGSSIPYVGATLGRVLSKNKIGGKYYFVYNNKFELNSDMRGFDCSSFVGSVFHISAEDNSGNAYSDGASLADTIGYSETHAALTANEFHTFFDNHPTGTYISYSGGHMILVRDAVVHEFNSTGAIGAYSDRGYFKTAAKDWPRPNTGGYAAQTIVKTNKQL